MSQIGPGLVCLIGMEQGDTESDSEYMCAAHFLYLNTQTHHLQCAKDPQHAALAQ